MYLKHIDIVFFRTTPVLSETPTDNLFVAMNHLFFSLLGKFKTPDVSKVYIQLVWQKGYEDKLAQRTMNILGVIEVWHKINYQNYKDMPNSFDKQKFIWQVLYECMLYCNDVYQWGQSKTIQQTYQIGLSQNLMHKGYLSKSANHKKSKLLAVIFFDFQEDYLYFSLHIKDKANHIVQEIPLVQKTSSQGYNYIHFFKKISWKADTVLEICIAFDIYTVDIKNQTVNILLLPTLP